MRNCTAMVLAIALAAFGATPSAHHGAAAYDMTATATLDATVVEFRWINPHALIEFEERAPDGTQRRWTAETAGLTILVRAGWTRTALQHGMHVTVVGHPGRNGTAT